MKKNNKKVSITTLNGYFNYGNRLQLFALSKTLRRLGFNVSVYWPKSFLKRTKELIKYRTILKKKYQKEYLLYSFTKKHIADSKNKRESIDIVGSDQVWNPSYLSKAPYLNVDSESLEISYAASIGRSTLNKEQKMLFKKMLKYYSAISVREKSAKDLLEAMTNKKVEVVLDPTLLLSKAMYASLEKKPNNIIEENKYILCYILGNRDHEEKIEKFAKEKGYETIYFSDKRDSDYGIEEFLYLIHHAELICTDSFHACVFSFIFERPFVAFKRTGEANYMYTRLQNLIDTFELKNREFNGKEITKENLEVDYSEAKKILEKEQGKSLNFLRKALDIEE